MSDIAVAYGPARMGREYGYRDSEYTKGYHRAQDVRTLSADGSYSIVDEVVSLTAGVVVDVRRANDQVAWVITVDTWRGRGRYEHHCHVADAIGVGHHVEAGTRLARNAGHGEDTGSSWSGPHDHFVITDYLDGAWNTNRPEYDPIPFINDAIGESMPLTPADKQIIKDSIYEFMLNTANPPSGYDAWPFMQASVWGAPQQAQDVNGKPLTDSDGNPVKFSSAGYLVSTNAIANAANTTATRAARTPAALALGLLIIVASFLAGRALTRE